MSIYKIAFNGDPDGQKGFDYVSSLREAQKRKREWDGNSEPGEHLQRNAEIEKLDIDPTKTGILRALNIYGGHPDNG